MLERCGAPLICCIFAFILALFSAPSLSAQSAGTISGHVSDPTGAVIPKAKITLIDTATGTQRTTVSTTSGDYTFPAVPPGTYNLEATHSGFKVSSAQNVQLQVQQSLTQDFTLQVGEVTQTVSVTATGALLQTQNSTLGTVVPTQTITQMPLNNRNYLGLVALSSNANTLSPTQGQAGARLGGSRANESISVGGQRINFDHYTLDGINNSDVDFNSFVVQPSVDAIQEMKVQTGVYPAQFGYNATQVNVVTVSGTNAYHGTAFEFLRNNYADALGYDYAYPTPLPTVLPLKYNDYGFVLDGPITIPHVFNGKDRFFFMVNDEWYSEINFTNSLRTQPSQAILNGDFSQYATSSTGSPVPIYDPTTGNPDGTGRKQFPGNVIPANRIDPVSAKFVQLFYAPAQNGQFTNNYQYLNKATDSHDGFNVRGDFYQSPASQWAFRFSNGLETVKNAGFTTPGGTVGSAIVTNFYQYMGSNTWTISPTIVNVATFGDTNFYNSLGTYSQGVDNAVGKVGIPNLQPGLSQTWGIPSVGFSPDRFTGLGDSSDGPYVTTDPDISINDTITWVHGKHSIDLGFQFDRQTFNELGNQFSRGSFAFQNNATARVSSPGVLASGTGSAFADFLLGYPYTSSYAVQIAQANYVRNVEAGFFDDNFKITPRLTLSAGLRYELTPPWYNTLGQEFLVDMTTNNSPISPTTGTTEPENHWPIFMREGNCNNAYQGINVRWVQADKVTPVTPQPQCANGDYPNSLMQTDYANWAPRIGASFTPTSTLVIRAGYGIYFNHDIANARFDMARNLAGRVTLTTGNGTPGQASLTWGNSVGGGGVAVIPPPYSFSMAYDHRTSNSQVYLLDVQKQLGSNWAFEAGYMGTLSHNLYGFRNANYSIPYGYIGNGAPTSILARTPYPNYGVIQYVHDQGIGRYNAFTLQATKRFSNGFNLISSYTFSKSLDDTSGIRTQQSQLFPQNDTCLTCDYGPSDFDVRHRVVASLIYDLPIGPGKLWAPSSKIVNAVIGGWEFTTLGTLQTGIPFTVNILANTADTNTVAGGTPATRPNVVSRNFIAAHPTAGKNGRWLNPDAFQAPAPGFLGNASRNMIHGPGVENFDMSLDKNFAMPYNEHHQLQIRFDAFNALNHVDFSSPNKYLDVPSTFGTITSSALPARELQLAARYSF
ncbi:MAG TPA: carboxypeptidase-like regulatory domain-containing protein [Acidobacteriaceae bacterium]|nr:carboxypeptidase-like regulatory domain-containing protein [Acidobacteriaceae bacterium]